MACRPSRLTISEALARSIYRVYRFWFCSRHFSRIVPLFRLKPQRLSETTSSNGCCVTRFSMMRAMIFPAIRNTEMPLWLSQDALSPLSLYSWTMLASLNLSWGTEPLTQIAASTQWAWLQWPLLPPKRFQEVSHQDPVLSQPGVQFFV